ncbi:MAG: hypothetical protein ISR43_02520 [Acidimicrobiia bacterium]|nr:hypothetical protein [Actinomycetota bacterium]MBL6924280.1 hypothetical protein [Acidimicrobiia bacterium]MBL6926089.1 hypothetical protein [Acidimicrobiia bacterium]
MTTPIPTRFNDAEVARIDWLVSQGIAENRSAVIRRAVERLEDAVRRERIGEAVATSYRLRPQSTDDDALAAANALAMTTTEPW